MNLITPVGRDTADALGSENMESMKKEGQVGGLLRICSADKIRTAMDYAVNEPYLEVPLIKGAHLAHSWTGLIARFITMTKLNIQNIY